MYKVYSLIELCVNEGESRGTKWIDEMDMWYFDTLIMFHSELIPPNCMLHQWAESNLIPYLSL